MRRLGLFTLVLTMLSLTTAFAASFQVQTEDITSFTTEVSISVPPTKPTGSYFLFRDNPAPGGISQTPEAGGPHKWKVEPTGTTELIDQVDPNHYYVWSTGALIAPLLLDDQLVEFTYYLTAGGRAIVAALLDCPAGSTLASTACEVVAQATSGGDKVTFGHISATIPAGHELRLKVVNPEDKFWIIEWGYKSNRDSHLEFHAPT